MFPFGEQPDYTGLISDHNLGRQVAALQGDLELLWPEFDIQLTDELIAYANGRFPASALRDIPGGRLEHHAAAAWIDMRSEIGRKHNVWIAPLGPNSSYRLYSAQQYFWSLYQSGKGNVAAFPGTSNHGWGLAVDVATTTMAYYIRKYGGKYGWSWDEGRRVGEWWHFRFVGGYKAKPAKPALPKVLSDKEAGWANKLRDHRHIYKREARGGKGPRYRKNYEWADHYRKVLNRQADKLTRLAQRAGSKKNPNWGVEKRGARRQAIMDVLRGKYDY